MIYLIIVIIVFLLIYFINKTSKISKKVTALEKELLKLKTSISPEDIKSESPPATIIEEHKIEPDESEMPLSINTIPVDRTKSSTGNGLLESSRTKEEWEAFIGGKLLNRIGAFALIIAVGFFLKYAFDNNIITETMRVVIGGLIGIGLLVLGNRFKYKGLDIFAQGLIGAGISILYLSVYACFNFYNLITQPVAFALMSFVTIIAFVQALAYNALSVSILAWAGGFLTPFLLSTGQSNEFGLFSYVIFLNIGILAIAFKKDSWWILEPLSLGATYVIYSQWYKQFYLSDNILIVILFLTIIWAIFYTLDFIRLYRRVVTYFEKRRIVASFNGLCYYLAIYIIIDPLYHQWMGLVTLILATIYFLSFLVLKRRLSDNKIIHMQYSLSAALLIVIATAIQFHGFTTIILWSLEASVIAWYGFRFKMSYIWQAAIGMFIIAIFKLLTTQSTYLFTPIENFTLILNLRSLTLITITVLLAIFLFLYRYLENESIKSLKEVVQYVISGLLFLFCTTETIDFFRLLSLNASNDLIEYYVSMRFLTLAVVWMVYSLIFVWIGLKKKALPILYCGLFALLIAILQAAIKGLTGYIPLEEFSLLFNLRTIVILFIILGSFLQLYWLKKNQKDLPWISQVYLALQIALVLLAFDLLTGESIDYFKKELHILEQNQSTADNLNQVNLLLNLQQLIISAVWLLYSIGLMVVGIWKRSQVLRISSIVLFGVTILKIFIYDLSFLDTFYRIFSFFGLGLILIIVSYLYNRYKDVIFDQTAR